MMTGVMLLAAAVFVADSMFAAARLAAQEQAANGFWRTRQDADGRWWAVSPQGQDAFLSGVDHATFIGHPCEKTRTRRYLETTNRRKYVFTLHPDKPLLLVECAELENTGAKPLDVRSLYFRQYAPYAGEAQPPHTTHPDLWKAPRTAGWQAADGRFWGGETRARGVTVFLYYVENGVAHPDAAIAPPGGAFILPPGGKWRAPTGSVWMICRAQRATGAP